MIGGFFCSRSKAFKGNNKTGCRHSQHQSHLPPSRPSVIFILVENLTASGREITNKVLVCRHKNSILMGLTPPVTGRRPDGSFQLMQIRKRAAVTWTGLLGATRDTVRC